MTDLPVLSTLFFEGREIQTLLCHLMVCFGYTGVFVAYRGDTNSFVDSIMTDLPVLSTLFLGGGPREGIVQLFNYFG